MKIIKSERGQDVLLHENFVYNIDKKYCNDEYKSFRCKQKGRKDIKRCPGMIRIKNICNTIIYTKPHNHNPDRAGRIAVEIKSELKELITTHEKPTNIVTLLTSKINNKDVAESYTTEYLRDCITRKRKPTVSKDTCNDNIPLSFRLTHTNCNFLLYDNYGQNEDRLIIFCSDLFTESLREAKIILMDGTFKTCPKEFYQIYSLHFICNGKSVPAIFGLLSNKTTNAYVKYLEIVAEKTGIKPDLIVLDFEQAAINACRTVFHNANISLCSFHYGQSIWKSIQKMGFIVAFNENKIFKNFVYDILNLVYHKQDKIYHTWVHLKLIYQQIIIDLKLCDLIKYIERTYIGIYELNDKQIAAPIYNPTLWSCFERIVSFQPRTINSLECWHKTIRHRAGKSNLNLCEFIELMKNEEEYSRVKLLQLQNFRFDYDSTYKNDLKLFFLVKSQPSYLLPAYLKLLRNVTRWKIEDKGKNKN